MASVEIKVIGNPGSSKRTEISVERMVELDAVAAAVGLLLASYGSDIRAALAKLARVVRLIEEYFPSESDELATQAERNQT